MPNITSNLAAVKAHIIDYAKKYGRDPASITLLAASKGRSVNEIQTAYAAGQHIFGENYLQEAMEKIPQLPSDIEWHFIGHIQRNKTKHIAEHFAWVHSVDNITIAKRLNDQRPAHLPPLNICIELNIDHEASKSGVLTNEAAIELALGCLSLPRLKLRGLMAIPAPQKLLAEQRKEFHQLMMLWQQLRDRSIALDTLSMGMSEDLEAAIAEGSTLVRIGTAIFGPRS